MSLQRATLPVLASALLLPALTAPAASAAETRDDFAAEMIVLINDYRADHGRGPVTALQRIERDATDHSIHMAETTSFKHASGSDLRADSRSARCSGGYGENIGRYWHSRGVRPDSPQVLMDGFIDSPGHRANMLDPDWTHVGVGFAVADDGTVFVTQRFGEDCTGTVSVHSGSPFTDVRPTVPHFEHMVWLKDSGITTGWADGSYRPFAPVDRNAMAAFLYRLAGSPSYTPPRTSPFTDVAPGDAFYKEITWAHKEGITTGWRRSDGSRQFRPLEDINRDAMAAFLYRFAGSPDFDAPDRSPFRDVRPGQDHYAAMAWMADTGISTGWSDRTYRPLEPIKRDAMAAFLHRTYEHLG